MVIQKPFKYLFERFFGLNLLNIPTWIFFKSCYKTRKYVNSNEIYVTVFIDLQCTFVGKTKTKLS